MAAIRTAVGTGGDTVLAAQEGVSRAEAALAAEAKRVEQAERELAEASDAIAEADPDGDDKTFARLVQRRDAARGKLEALQVRHGRAQKAIGAAKQALKDADRDSRRSELEQIDAEIRRRSEALTAKAVELSAAIETENAVLRDLAQRAHALDLALRMEATGEPEYRLVGVSLNRGSPWVSFGGGSALELAARVVRL
jgi:hypothetical protein